MIVSNVILDGLKSTGCTKGMTRNSFEIVANVGVCKHSCQAPIETITHAIKNGLIAFRNHFEDCFLGRWVFSVGVNDAGILYHSTKNEYDCSEIVVWRYQGISSVNCGSEYSCRDEFWSTLQYDLSLSYVKGCALPHRRVPSRFWSAHGQAEIT